MVKIEVGRGRRLAASRRRSEMASKWSKYLPVSGGAQFRKGRVVAGDVKERFLGRATELMYAAQQGDVDRVKKIVKEEVSRPLSPSWVDIFIISTATC